MIYFTNIYLPILLAIITYSLGFLDAIVIGELTFQTTAK